MRPLVVLAVLGACGSIDRPIHPLRLEGFPGAPIEPGLFPLRAGARWEFTGGLVLRLAAGDGELVLEGRKDTGAVVRAAGGFLEIVYQGAVVERPLKLAGSVGDTWRVGAARYTAFGYDRVEVLGEERRALVVAVDRGDVRDLYWFAPTLGWVRIRTERQGSVERDVRLVAFDPGGAN